MLPSVGAAGNLAVTLDRLSCAGTPPYGNSPPMAHPGSAAMEDQHYQQQLQQQALGEQRKHLSPSAILGAPTFSNTLDS